MRNYTDSESALVDDPLLWEFEALRGIARIRHDLQSDLRDALGTDDGLGEAGFNRLYKGITEQLSVFVRDTMVGVTGKHHRDAWFLWPGYPRSLASLGRTYPDSWISLPVASMTRARSATIRLGAAFAASSSRSRFTSCVSMPEYLRFET
ncbi:hypothetical protein A3A71_03295 [Candidatus Berkelbacteria bacterium RIFCSPLOWO2_01_FULL_50_28]|uniref:Uncharacterized protein n=1 Tax=Candidatus Berkelbacteria bacterium RIFCSPLOWO2_01_FULL_50_28 TaxID=1797471 RepID=A0A1F5ECV3_9BACT|nr:MAG: hypothetical protein A2807_02860 [Candidatus Berkelbacteria bacterium RIFCSPHIGHO2_01_FULL_50_36]OGD65086.1 MAG: hypothetical protein A3A71_03295 [Candidatus Berkelbacteria bacterium RIFCSPLOWO2_01_FULL_50_28]